MAVEGSNFRIPVDLVVIAIGLALTLIRDQPEARTWPLLLAMLGGCGRPAGPEVGEAAPSVAERDAFAFQQNRRIGRGVNLGNALEAPKEGEWGVVLEEEFFPLIQAGGFDSVRVPIRWNAHAAQEPHAHGFGRLCAIECAPVVAPEAVLVQSITHPLQGWPRQACGVQPAGAREFDLVFDRLAGQHRGHSLLANRLPDRARLDLREVLRQRLHGALHFTHAFETQLLVLGLLLQLRVSRQRHHADERENRDRHQHFEQRETALAGGRTGGRTGRSVTPSLPWIAAYRGV